MEHDRINKYIFPLLPHSGIKMSARMTCNRPQIKPIFHTSCEISFGHRLCNELYWSNVAPYKNI